MRKLEYVDGYGKTVTKTIMAEFCDEDGFRFFVVSARRGTYDPSPPYDVVRYEHGVTRVIGG